MRNNNLSEATQEDTKNFPNINDEYNIVGSRRRPSADIGRHHQGAFSQARTEPHHHTSKATPVKGSSRGTAQNEASNNKSRTGQQSPLTPVGRSNRKNATLVKADGSVAVMVDKMQPIQKNSQMNNKHRSIDEVKMMVNNQVRNNKEAQSTTARRKPHPNNSFLDDVEHGAAGFVKQGNFTGTGAREAEKGQHASAAKYQRGFEQAVTSPLKGMGSPKIEYALSNGNVTKQQEFFHADQQKRFFDQVNNKQTQGLGGIGTHSTALTHISSPNTRRPQGSQNNESSFLPKIDKNNQNVTMMAQTQIPSSLKHTRGTVSPDEKSHGSGNIGRSFATGRVHEQYQNNSSAASKGQMISFDNKLAAPHHNADYFANNGELPIPMQSQLRGSNKMKTGNITNQQMMQHYQQVNQQQQISTRPNKGHHIKAHSQNFESVHNNMQMMMSQNRGPGNVQNYRRDKNESQLREKQDKQLEDLNETLQRLAREKYTKNVPGGAGGMQGRKKQRNATTYTDKPQYAHDAQYMVAGIDPMLNHLHGFEKYNTAQQIPNNASATQGKSQDTNNAKKKEKKKQKKQAQAMDLMQQKYESQQRNALIMGDPLVNQRLQGVKQAPKGPNQVTVAGKSSGPTVQQNSWQQNVGQNLVNHPQQEQSANQYSGYKGNNFTNAVQLAHTPQGPQAALDGAQTTPAQTQKIFKINMTLIDRSQAQVPNTNPNAIQSLGSMLQPNHPKNEKLAAIETIVMGSNSAQHVYARGANQFSSDEPLIMRSKHDKIQSAQPPITFRQSQQEPLNQNLRASNLIGPERIIQQSIALDSNSSSKVAVPQYHTQSSMSEAGSRSPWMQSQVHGRQKQQSVWNQANLEQKLPNAARISMSHSNKINQDNPQTLRLQIDQQYSTVLEDVEMEQMASPLRAEQRSEQRLESNYCSQDSIKQNKSDNKRDQLHTETSNQTKELKAKATANAQGQAHPATLSAPPHLPRTSPRDSRPTHDKPMEMFRLMKSDISNDQSDGYSSMQQNEVNAIQPKTRKSPLKNAKKDHYYKYDSIDTCGPNIAGQLNNATPVQFDSMGNQINEMKSPQFAGSRNQDGSIHEIGSIGQGIIQKEDMLGIARMNETTAVGGIGIQLQSTFGAAALATTQDFPPDSARRSHSNNKKMQMASAHSRESPQKLPMLIMKSPRTKIQGDSALKGSREGQSLRASLKNEQGTHLSAQKDELGKHSKRLSQRQFTTIEQQNNTQQHKKKRRQYDSIPDGNESREREERIEIHMSQVFSVMSQEEQEEGNNSARSFNDNVQIIHQGIDPETTAEKFLTHTYSGSPRNKRNTNEGNHQEAKAAQLDQDNSLTVSHSKQSPRGNSSTSRHKKQIVEERKVVQRTQTQRLADAVSSQQRNEQVIQSQLNDLTGQVSVSKMQTETQLHLEIPGQGTGGRQSAMKKSKSKTLREQHGRSPSRGRQGEQSSRGSKPPQGTQGRNAGQSQTKQSVEPDGNRNNGPRNSSNQQQHRKTQSNISPTKRDRQVAGRQDPKQGQKPQQSYGPSRPQTPPGGDEGEMSSDAPESVHQLRLGFKIARDNYSFCHEYLQFKGQHRLPKECRYLFTGRSYQKGESQFAWSTRLYLSRECALSEDRRRYPILIVNLDGAVGTWDDSNKSHYILRPRVVEGLIQLSYDFRLIAVSSNRQKLICRVVQALMNIPPGSSATGGQSVDAANNSSLLHLVFDAVYQLNSQNADVKYTNSIKNIDEIHFDLTQALTDMQFQKHKKAKPSSNKENEALEVAHQDKFQTFWETEAYRPCKKVLILTTDRWLFKSRCYSFDYNFLFQARKFMHEESKKAPIVLQLPHMRLNPKVSFDIALQTVFALQNVAQALSCQMQQPEKCVEGEIYNNPDLSGFEICKKLLSSRLRNQQHKMKREGNSRGLRVFDQQRDLFVDLELIDFGQAYSFLKKYMCERKSDWLAVKKYYLLYKPERVEITPLKLKQNLKVTFEESPDIRRIGDDQREKAGSSLNGRAGATTHDSSKSDKFSFVKNQYVSEEAKNLYNALMIRNYKIQQEINSYARHHRIQQQRKLEKKKEQDRLTALQEEHQTPIVIYDSDKDEEARVAEPKLRSSLKEYPTHKMNLEKEKREKEVTEQKQKKEKKYAFKYRVLQIRTCEPIDELGDISLKHYSVINLRVRPVTQYALRVPGGQMNDTTTGSLKDSQVICATPRYVPNQDYLHHNANAVLDGLECRNFLVDLLSKRQTKISYSTNQEMHLKNNLNQLVDGEQQYKDQHQKLTQDEKEQQLAAGQNQHQPGDASQTNWQ